MLIDNLEYQYIYNAITKLDKIDLYKSKKVKLTRLN